LSSPNSTEEEIVDESTEPEEELLVDEERNALISGLKKDLGDDLIESHVTPGVDVWIRVTQECWLETAKLLFEKNKMSFFNFLSAIDWKPSPFGREMDAAIDNDSDDQVEGESEMEWGITGGQSRFQLLARVHNPSTNIGIHVKADLEGEFPEVETWIPVYPGANWHEREVMEMFGISFTNHPNLVNLYLPTEFEGHPLRKDFPLLSRRAKPWPGIVDVELMPGEDDDESEEIGEDT
jgi:NADH-quinone oxidoreductase subunit C|tara:strand:- start:5709 stop:6419 length:711 start_codon:yes stop_codon:yes gene_type:complete